MVNLEPVIRFQWLNHMLRREENEPLRAVFKWKPQGKRPRGRSKNRWIDGVAKDL